MYEGSKEEVIRNNLLQFEMQTEGKTPEIDFNELIFKAKRIPVKQYVEYKREIRLSKLKQVDIAANITDMKNLAALREVRGRYFDQTHPPANSLIPVTALAGPQLLLEIEAVVDLGER